MSFVPKFDRVLRLGVAGIAVLSLVACSPSEPRTDGGQRLMRRLTEDQYRNSIADIFGADIKVAGRFEPIIRPRMELLADGTALAAVSPAGFEQYETMARAIATQVVDEAHRNTLIPCRPANAAEESACATQFYRTVGRLLYRRPLTDQEVTAQVKIAEVSEHNIGDFYAGLSLGLAGMLVSPEFLFRMDSVENDPEHAGHQRLDGYAKAARLSYFLWNSTPDDELLTAAEHGDLNTKKGLDVQVKRLLASARLSAGMKAFFADMFEFEQMDELAKDPVIYPKFSHEVARDAQEETLRTTLSLLIDQDGDYRDLFTTRRTFITRPLGRVYRIPVTARTGWQPAEFPPDSGRDGIVSRIAFLAINSHEGRSSPTLRGRGVREKLLCEKVPDPPSNVDFKVVQDVDNPMLKTARSRLTAHRNNPSCAGCHKFVDPIGLGLENFDGLGEYRANENGEAIDASGEIDGMTFKDAASLGQALHDDPAVPACLVRKMYEYAVGRTPSSGERDWITFLDKQFADDHYRLRGLVSRIVTSDAFYAVKPAASRVMAVASDH